MLRLLRQRHKIIVKLTLELAPSLSYGNLSLQRSFVNACKTLYCLKPNNITPMTLMLTVICVINVRLLSLEPYPLLRKKNSTLWSHKGCHYLSQVRDNTPIEVLVLPSDLVFFLSSSKKSARSNKWSLKAGSSNGRFLWADENRGLNMLFCQIEISG